MKHTAQLLMISLLFFLTPIFSQTITKQFQETKYDIKDFCMVDSNSGWGVGGVHWDQSIKRFKSTIIKTSNAGENWIKQNCDFDDDLWGVHFIDGNKGWAVGDSGCIIYTNNGGASWVQQEVNTTFNFKSVYFTDESNGWAVANEPVHFSSFDNEPDGWKGRIWHTTNGGDSWAEQTTPPDIGLIHRIYFQNSLKGWGVGVKNYNINVFVDTYCAAYYTEDGGQTWIEKFSPELKLVFTDIQFTDNNHGWIVGFQSSSGEIGGCVFRTSDGGENWQRIADESFANALWQVEFVDSLKGYLVGADYPAAWGPPVFRTMDGGATWQKIRMVEHHLMGLYGWAVFNDKVIAVGDKGYVVTSTDPWGGMGQFAGEELFTQKLINVLYEFEDVFFINELKGWVVGKKSVGPQDWAQVILHTNDGGQNWAEQYSFSSEAASFAFRLSAVQFISDTKGWASGDSRNYGDNHTTGILFTDDGGQTWTQQAQGVSDGEIVDIFFLDQQNGWALTNKNIYPGGYIQILKTVDGGSSWKMINTEQPGMITIGYAIKSGKIFFQDSNTGWVLGAQCKLIKTTDGGENWTTMALPQQYYNTYSIAFRNQQTGYICGGYKNFRTTDGGENWVEEELIDNTLTDLTFIDAQQGWMVGEWGLIYHTGDGGATWDPVENSVSAAALKSVSFANKNYCWAAGRGGTIIKIDNSNSTMVLDGHTEKIPELYKLYQNHPNPFNPVTTIRYYLPAGTTVKLSIYDLLGREVTVLVNEIKAAGTHQVEFDASQLGSGVYIYHLQTDDFSTAKQMILLK